MRLSQMDRFFRLTDSDGSLGLSCTSSGISLAGVPLLRMTISGFAPRSADEIHALIGGAYGPDINPTALALGLEVIAKALNQGDLARAMVAAVRLRLPDLSWEGAVRITHIENALAKHNFDPDEPRDTRGRWMTGGAGYAGNSAMPNAPETADHEVNPETITPAAYNGFFHDDVVADYASYLRSKGQNILTEVRLAMADGSVLSRIDILGRDPKTAFVYGIEVKTGDRPDFTEGQAIVYPHLMWGESVVAIDGEVLALGLSPGIPLKPIPIFLLYQKDPGTKPIVEPINPEKLYSYGRGR